MIFGILDKFWVRKIFVRKKNIFFHFGEKYLEKSEILKNENFLNLKGFQLVSLVKY